MKGFLCFQLFETHKNIKMCPLMNASPLKPKWLLVKRATEIKVNKLLFQGYWDKKENT